MSWYAITYGPKLTASSAWPSMSFVDQAGQTSAVPLEDILKEYDDWRKKTHGNQAAA
ncbi:hypothetical protein [Streptomyces cinereoruber]|uniref:hypothetical protein n=1 Tax=Streptomyces cinereoruber TaxID=67260 RepID=UPI00362CCB15